MKLIVFDLDGTVVDSQDNIVEAQARTFRAHGLEPPSRERSLSIVGLSLPEAFAVLAGEERAHALAATYREVFVAMRADPGYREPLFPLAAETIAGLGAREDVLLGIATGKARRGVAHLLAGTGWENLFATIQTADDAPSKPHPQMLLQALAETGIEPGDAVMIGDSTFDMAMARAAGVRALGVTWGYHRPEDLVAAGAEVLVQGFAELDAALTGLWPRAFS